MMLSDSGLTSQTTTPQDAQHRLTEHSRMISPTQRAQQWFDLQKTPEMCWTCPQDF